MDSSTSTSETSENAFLFAFISSFVSFGVSIYVCSKKSNFKQKISTTVIQKGINRSSHRRCSIKRGILRNFAKFIGKHPCPSLFFNKVGGLRPATLWKKRLGHRRFPVNFAKFLRTAFLLNTSGGCFLSEQWPCFCWPASVLCNYKPEKPTSIGAEIFRIKWISSIDLTNVFMWIKVFK